jgi:hypothetical protein
MMKKISLLHGTRMSAVTAAIASCIVLKKQSISFSLPDFIDERRL